MPSPYIIPPLEGDKEFQVTGLTDELKLDMKTQAIKRNCSTSALLVAAYLEFTKRHPLAS